MAKRLPAARRVSRRRHPETPHIEQLHSDTPSYRIVAPVSSGCGIGETSMREEVEKHLI
jgi:hypothetical protein